MPQTAKTPPSAGAPPIIVEIQGLGNVEFPAGTPPETIKKAIDTQMDQQWGGSDTEEETPSYLSRLGESAKDFLQSGMTVAGAVHGMPGAGKALAQGIGSTLAQSAKDAATLHPIRAALRLVGVDPEKAATDYTAGNYGALAGDVTMPGVLALAPKVLPNVSGLAGRATRLGARATGSALQTAGEHPLLGASGLAYGAYSGNVPMAATGAAILLTKPMLRSVGSKLHAWGSVPAVKAFADEFLPSLEEVTPAMAKKLIADQAVKAHPPEIQQFLRELNAQVDITAQTVKEAAPVKPSPSPEQIAAEKAAAEQTKQWRAETHQLQKTTRFEQQQTQAAQRAAEQRAQAAAKAQKEAAAAEEIAAAREGLEAQPPSISETISAPTATGRETMTRRYAPPEEEMGASVETPAPPATPTAENIRQMLQENRLPVALNKPGMNAPPLEPVASHAAPAPPPDLPALQAAMVKATRTLQPQEAGVSPAEIRQALRLAPSHEVPKTPITDVIPSKSKSARGTGSPLSPNDLEAAGIALPPGVKPVRIATELLEKKVYPSRASRHQTVYQNAISNLRYKLATEGASPTEIELAVEQLKRQLPKESK